MITQTASQQFQSAIVNNHAEHPAPRGTLSVFDSNTEPFAILLTKFFTNLLKNYPLSLQSLSKTSVFFALIVSFSGRVVTVAPSYSLLLSNKNAVIRA